jgi:hypothetical protein
MLQEDAQVRAEAKLQEEVEAAQGVADVGGGEGESGLKKLEETEEFKKKKKVERSIRLRKKKKVESEETVLWSEILKMTWELRLLPLVQQSARVVLDKEWSPDEFKEIVLLQIEAHFIRGHSYVEAVRGAPKRLWSSSKIVDGLHPKALGILVEGLSEKLVAMKKQVIESFVSGCELAVQLGEKSLVENAAVYLWNFHLHVFRDVKGVRPSGEFIFFLLFIA